MYFPLLFLQEFKTTSKRTYHTVRHLKLPFSLKVCVACWVWQRMMRRGFHDVSPQVQVVVGQSWYQPRLQVRHWLLMFTFLIFDALTQVTCSYILHVQSPPSVQTSIDPCTKDPRAKGGQNLFWYAFNLTRRGSYFSPSFPPIFNSRIHVSLLSAYGFRCTSSRLWLIWFRNMITLLLASNKLFIQLELRIKGSNLLSLHQKAIWFWFFTLLMVSKRWQVCKTVLNWLRF